jgi:hypothetical protein
LSKWKIFFLFDPSFKSKIFSCMFISFLNVIYAFYCLLWSVILKMGSIFYLSIISASREAFKFYAFLFIIIKWVLLILIRNALWSLITVNWEINSVLFFIINVSLRWHLLVLRMETFAVGTWFIKRKWSLLIWLLIEEISIFSHWAWSIENLLILNFVIFHHLLW